MPTKLNHEFLTSLRADIDRRLEILQHAILPLDALQKPTGELVKSMLAGQEALLQAVTSNTRALVESRLVPAENAAMLHNVTLSYVTALAESIREQLVADIGAVPTGGSKTPTTPGNGTVH